MQWKAKHPWVALISLAYIPIVYYIIISEIVVITGTFQVGVGSYKDLGQVAQVFMLLSFAYAVIYYLFHYRRYIYSVVEMVLDYFELYTDDVMERFGRVKLLVKRYYARFRKPLLYIHGSLNLVAVVLATFHGLSMLPVAKGTQVFTGVILYSLMFIMAIFGFIVLFRVKISRVVFKYSRIIHKQWVYTIILLLMLLLHSG